MKDIKFKDKIAQGINDLLYLETGVSDNFPRPGGTDFLYPRPTGLSVTVQLYL